MAGEPDTSKGVSPVLREGCGDLPFRQGVTVLPYPINFSSAGKGKDQRYRQGNRNLNKIFHFLAIQLIQVNKNGTARHPAFRRYFERKLKENKTKPQALVCVSKRALKIVYGMMRTKSEYRPFEECQG
jgi:hypothetical protein